MDEENITREFSNAICKSVMYISLAVLGGMWISSCGLDDDTIATCQEACKESDSYMSEVTSSKCVCAGKDSALTSPFVLPGG